MNRTSPYSTRTQGFTPLAAALALTLSLGAFGCGATYRPVVSAVNPVGPAGQPTKYAITISNTGNNNPGLVTIVDVYGDTVLVTPNVGANPKYLQLDSPLTGSSSTGYVLNGDGTFNSFGISTSLMTNGVLQSTLLAGANPVSLLVQGTSTYIAEAGRNSVAQLTGTPPALKQELPTGQGTIYTVGINGAIRVYALAEGNGLANGTATAIETGTNTISASLPVGVQPVYGVMTADGRRAFVMNKGNNTVSVINSQTNQLDTFTSPKGGVTSTIPVGIAPVWADFAPTLSELVVANAGTGTGNGSVSIISIPLCSATAITTNPNCDPANPIDAVGFGAMVATIPAGVNPVMVAVLQDGTQAYVANAGNAAAGIPGSVTIINLTTNTVTATIPAQSTGTTLGDTVVHGHPAWIAATTGTPTGKVYVTSLDSNDLTVIRTDVDSVTTHIPLQGTGIAVRVTMP